MGRFDSCSGAFAGLRGPTGTSASDAAWQARGMVEWGMPEGIAGRVDASNEGQLDAWDGDAGDYWAAHADRFDEAVAGYHERFLSAATIDATARVLDVGCGAGRTTRDAARRAEAGSALGVDLSSRMLELARRRADDERVANVEFRRADAQTHPFPPASVDVALSRHGAMFFGDPSAAFANLAHAVRPGGRLVLLTWQPFERQEWLRTFFAALAAGRELSPPPPDAPGPFALSDPRRIRGLLSSAGFRDVQVRDLAEHMYFGSDPDDATDFVAGQLAAMLRDLDDHTRRLALDDLRAGMADHHTDRGVTFDSAAWLVEARGGWHRGVRGATHDRGVA